jgi:hypothetical protein
MRTAWVAGVLAVGLATSAMAQGPSVKDAKTLSKGTKISATTQDPISSSKNKIGDEVSATINDDVKDANGNVIFPAGSNAKVKIIDIKPADDKNKDGALALQVSSVKTNTQNFTITATSDTVATESKKPGWTSDTKKLGIGAAAGAVVGGLATGNLRGAIAGGLIGAAGGAVVTHEMNGKEVVVKQGTKIDFKLEEPVQVMTT